MIVTCPHCVRDCEAPATALGKKIRCPRCQAIFVAKLPAAEVIEDDGVTLAEPGGSAADTVGASSDTMRPGRSDADSNDAGGGSAEPGASAGSGTGRLLQRSGQHVLSLNDSDVPGQTPAYYARRDKPRPNPHLSTDPATSRAAGDKTAPSPSRPKAASPQPATQAPPTPPAQVPATTPPATHEAVDNTATPAAEDHAQERKPPRVHGWYVLKSDGSEVGPLASKVIVRAVKDGKITPQTKMRHSKRKDRVIRAGQVPELFGPGTFDDATTGMPSPEVAATAGSRGGTPPAHADTAHSMPTGTAKPKAAKPAPPPTSESLQDLLKQTAAQQTDSPRFKPEDLAAQFGKSDDTLLDPSALANVINWEQGGKALSASSVAMALDQDHGGGGLDPSDIAAAFEQLTPRDEPGTRRR